MVTRNGKDRISHLHRQVEQDRVQLRVAIARAQEVARRKLDVPERVANHRWAWLGAGFALGLLIGATRGGD